MIEFSLVAPLIFLLLFGIIEFGTMTFDVGSSRYAASEAARALAAGGDSFNLCKDVVGCSALHPSWRASDPCDADCQALVAINKTALGSTSLQRVNFVDITLLTAGGQPANPLTQNHYDTWSGTANDFGVSCSLPCNYTSNTRGVTAGSTNYVSVRVNFSYRWLTKMFADIAPLPTFDAIYFIHLEPRRF